MYIFDKNNHQIYKGNHVSLVVVIRGGTGKTSSSLLSPLKQSPSLTLFIITISLVNIIIIITQYFTYSKSINKLKVISAVCVVKEQVWTLKEAESYLHENQTYNPAVGQRKKKKTVENKIRSDKNQKDKIKNKIVPQGIFQG